MKFLFKRKKEHKEPNSVLIGRPSIRVKQAGKPLRREVKKGSTVTVIEDSTDNMAGTVYD